MTTQRYYTQDGDGIVYDRERQHEADCTASRDGATAAAELAERIAAALNAEVTCTLCGAVIDKRANMHFTQPAPDAGLREAAEAAWKHIESTDPAYDSDAYVVKGMLRAALDAAPAPVETSPPAGLVDAIKYHHAGILNALVCLGMTGVGDEFKEALQQEREARARVESLLPGADQPGEDAPRGEWPAKAIWSVYSSEYPEDGSVTVDAFTRDEAIAEAVKDIGTPDGLAAVRLTADDWNSLRARIQDAPRGEWLPAGTVPNEPGEWWMKAGRNPVWFRYVTERELDDGKESAWMRGVRWQRAVPPAPPQP